MTDPITLDINAIVHLLPHRYPFLLVDRVLECIPGKSIRALKNVTYNEPFFPGHFPGRPLMPGVMVIEALAQSAGILAFVTAGVVPNHETKFYFVGIDKARFRKPVVPGDRLELKIEILQMRSKFGKAKGEAFVEGQLVTEAVFSFAIVDKESSPS